MTAIKKSTNNTCWRGYGNPLTLFLGIYIGTATTENSMEIPQKLEFPYDPVIPLLGIYPDKTITQKDSCTPMFIALFTVAKTRKSLKCPLTDEWMKMWYIYTVGC